MTTKKHPATPRRPPARRSFPIVGIGASAGGLEAVSELLKHLPPDTGMAFVLVQHLDPTHESMIGDILAKKTLMPVAEIKNNTCAQPGHLYVISPNSSLRISHGVFKVTPRLKNKGVHLPVDSFFKSLAQDQKHKSIGIILSGTASDGTFGLEAIRTAGGLSIAQDPESAKYEGMPRSAIAAGVVDLVLTPKNISEELVRIARHPLIMRTTSNQGLQAQDLVKSGTEGCFGKILALLYDKCHVDFSHYKRNTLNRRIARRMALHKTKHLSDYLDYLEKHPDEIDTLFADILINVTEFFRNPDTFAKLRSQIFPAILRNRETDAPIRIWVVGCASGEEAYSVAMALMECLGEPTVVKHPIQLFATDISEIAIKKARAGVYPYGIRKYVSKERLQRFFTKTDTGYTIKNFIREICLFSWHDVTSDPPYAKLDLICCRNLLIYFDNALQEQVLRIFHYALKSTGILWLGNSENIGKLLPTFFNVADNANKFYARKATPSLQKFHFSAGTHIPAKLAIVKKLAEQTIYSSVDIGRETDHMMALKYAPPGVVVNNAMEIIHVRGEIGPYLQLPVGQPSFNLFKMARAELASDLRMTIRLAKKKNGPVRKEGCALQVNGQLNTFAIEVIPFIITPASLVKERYFLISFESLRSDKLADLPVATAKERGDRRFDSQDQYIKELEQEQSDTKTYQKSLIADFEITQEELTSTNEELQTTIEELQSTNEELETAKEELQSANEELTTVNDELQSRNTDLVTLNDDLVNLIGCVAIPIVMVGIDGRVRRFTPKAGTMLNLIRTDVGRPISDINPNFDNLDLATLVSEVIETIAIKEMNIQDRKGRWFRLQIRPYKTTENKIDGAVIALVDINRLQLNLMESESSLDYAKNAITESKKANQSKDIFLAMLSHELRTPLTAILCWTQLLLQMGEGSEKLRHGLEIIEQNAKIQEQLIDDLLDVSRIQAGKIMLSISPLDPVDVVRKALESIRPLAENKPVIIRTHIKPLNVKVAADPARLQQIIWNLLINAIKFSHAKKTIAIRVKTIKKKGQPFFLFQVIDHGIGIKADFLPHLFERFTQADNKTTRLHGGLGLGLTITHDLLKLMGGSISAQSTGVGKGATFTVLLPLVAQAAQQKIKAKSTP